MGELYNFIINWGKNNIESKGENYILNIILENNREFNFWLWKENSSTILNINCIYGRFLREPKYKYVK